MTDDSPMTERNEGDMTGDPEGGFRFIGRRLRRPAPVYFDLSAYRDLVSPDVGFDHQVWLDPCSSAKDATAIWSAFNVEATAEHVDRLLRMRHPEYLHHDNVTHHVRVVDVDRVDPARLPSGHFITGAPTPEALQ